MFEAKVYTTAILSLSGMMDETHTARETVSRFSQQHAASSGRRCLAYRNAVELKERVAETLQAQLP